MGLFTSACGSKKNGNRVEGFLKFNRYLMRLDCVGPLLLGWLLIGEVSAQSLLVGIPSADVAGFGHVEFTHESQWARKNNRLDWTSFNFLTYGVRKNTELALSVVNVASPGSQNVAIGFGYKTLVPISALDGRLVHETKLSVGQMGYASIGPLRAQAKPFGGWVYSHLSSRLVRTQTRLTAGVSYGTSHVFGFRYASDYTGVEGEATAVTPRTPFCFIGGIEQPITKHVGFVMDWFSGSHEIAALIPAVQFTLGKQVVILGYKRANDRRAGDALVTELMVHF